MTPGRSQRAVRPFFLCSCRVHVVARRPSRMNRPVARSYPCFSLIKGLNSQSKSSRVLAKGRSVMSSIGGLVK